MIEAFTAATDARRAVWFFAVVGFLWIGLLLGLTMADVHTRNEPRPPAADGPG